jgi:hypothetical protein
LYRILAGLAGKIMRIQGGEEIEDFLATPSTACLGRINKFQKY